MDQPLYCSAADAGVWGERGYGDGCTPYTWLSSTALLPWLLDFPPQAFPTTFSSLTCTRFISLQSTATLARGLLHNPWTPAPSHCTVSGLYGCGKDCLILIPFRLPQISCFTFSLKYFSSDSDNCPSMGIKPLHQFPHLPRAGPVLLTLLFFPLVASFYWVLRGSVRSFPLVRYSCPLSAGVLHALLCLKVYLWYIHGGRYSMSTYSSAIFFSSFSFTFINRWLQ